jgi:biotin transport system substrate-specific component
MSTVTLAPARPTLVDRVLTRSIATDVVLVAAGAALTGVAAQIAVPLWPVPITGQTLAVLIVGSSLGAVRGGLSMVLYALLGLIGLPVFAPQSDGSHLTGTAAVMSPTFGYIIGFVLAAVLTGWLAQRNWDHRILGAVASFAAGTVVTFAAGLPWLAVVLHLNVQQTLVEGLYPFILGGAIKAALAAIFMRLSWFWVNRADERRAAQPEEE